MHRSRSRISRLPRALAAAALPVALVTAGCSLSGDDGQSTGSTPSPAPESSSPTVAPAKYDGLPDACDAIPRETVEKLVKKVKKPSGNAVKSNDTSVRAGCSWTGLAGYQWRWLDVSYQRYDSDPAIGSGAERAEEGYAEQLEAARSTEGAEGMKTTSPAGLGEEATTFAYEVTKKKEKYQQQTVVVRDANIVVTLHYNGTGFEDGHQPKAGEMTEEAEKAAEQAVSAIG